MKCLLVGIALLILVNLALSFASVQANQTRTSNASLYDCTLSCYHGKDGRDGINGRDGKDGPNGADGRNGKDGQNGADGRNGKDGQNGADGRDGLPGQNGRDGCRGRPGENGTKGAKGDQGYKGPKGDLGATGMQGSKGDKGDQGARGPQGHRGLQGATGPQGTKGNQGALGPQGLKGKQGALGPQGTKGKQGALGPQGLKGNRGALGPQGTKGNRGALGPQGVKGKQGALGPQGTKGNQGALGPQGVKGEQGAMGPQGAMGSKGRRGANGTCDQSALKELKELKELIANQTKEMDNLGKKILGCYPRSRPLGMENGAINNSQITASSVYSEPTLPRTRFEPYEARLNNQPHEWVAGHQNVNQWLQIAFLKPTTVTGVATQGEADGHSPGNEWVKTYMISYSRDGSTWKIYQEHSGANTTLRGNNDTSTVVERTLAHPLRDITYLRFLPQTWHSFIAMRVEVYGC